MKLLKNSTQFNLFYKKLNIKFLNRKRTFIECPFLFLFLIFFLTSSILKAEEKYFYEVDDPTTSTVTKESFYQHFYGVTSLFFQEMLIFRLPIQLAPEWEQPYFTAYTAEVNHKMKLGFWGGMARIPGMNDDAIALITCHEVGHIIGGAPYIQIPLSQYDGLSSEGQADYFATNICLKEYFLTLADTISYLNKSLPKKLQDQCKRFSDQTIGKAICLRVMNGIEGFRHVMMLMKPELGNVQYHLEDTSIAQQTNFNNYPTNQCRVDTFKAGLFNEKRPACWFQTEYP